MARVLITNETDLGTYVELFQDADEGDWGGACDGGCNYAILDDYGRNVSLVDAVEAATIHLDHKH